MYLQRYAFVPSTAAAVTFGLFYLMQSLVMTDEITLSDVTKPLRFVDIIQDVESTPPPRKINRLIKPEPPEELPPIVEPPTVIKGQGPNLPVSRPPIPVVPRPLGQNLKLFDGERVPIVRVTPKYPERALQRSIEGWVMLGFTVDQYGTVIDPVVIQADPKGYFERAAIKAVKRFKYKPTVVDGQARPSHGVRLRLSFNIDKD